MLHTAYRLGANSALKEAGFNEPIFAHELGHADDLGVGDDFQSGYGTFSRLGAPLLGLLGAGAVGYATKNPWLAAATAGLGQLPGLRDEHVASQKGLQSMKDWGRSDEEVEASKTLLDKAFGSYLVSALSTAATAGLATKAYKEEDPRYLLGILPVMLARMGVNRGLKASAIGDIPKTPTVSKAQARRHIKDRGYDLPIHEAEGVPGAYIPKTPDPNFLEKLLYKELIGEKGLKDVKERGAMVLGSTKKDEE